MDKQNYKSGFVAIVGRPNVGKSTFLNHVIGQKVAIISNKAQTTRNKIQGIYTTVNTQIVFIDTPGIHKPKTKLDDFMVKSALSSLNEVDAILMMINATQTRGAGDNFIIDRLKYVTKPVYLIINKIDQIYPDDLLGLIDQYKNDIDWYDVIPISALKGNNVEILLETLTKQLPNGPQYYPEEQITDHPERFVISELIREKILQATRQEVPYSIAVVIDKVSNQNKDKIHVQATIVVERMTQKIILIGKHGSMIKKIGILARQDIEIMLADKIFLELWVKVVPNWRNKPSALQNYGYRKSDY